MHSHEPRAQPGDPRDVALRALDWSYPDTQPPDALPGLEQFQARAVTRLSRIIEQRGGAILADSVGLGKTHVATALIFSHVEAGGTALVVAPAQLRAHWERHLRKTPRCGFMSHTALSRALPARHVRAVRSAPRPSLIVVDEAHGFRNARTRRYVALALLCEHARVLLLTATPVNNSLFDFYHLVRLFAARRDFADVGVPDLLAAVESATRGGSAAELRRVAAAVVVRRTRDTIVADSSPLPSKPGRSFPERAPLEVIRYDMAAAFPALLAVVLRVVPSLMFPAHSISARAPSQLMQLGLLKRLESSAAAFHTSLRRHIRVLEQFAEAARDGLLFEPVMANTHGAEVDGAVQLSLRSITLSRWPGGVDRIRMLEAADADLQGLRELHRLLTAAPAADPKLAALAELLRDTDRKVIVFTAFQDTAHDAWRALSSMTGLALITGGDARLGRARASRRTIVDRFAPLANRARVPRTTEAVRILIATDVLSEGMNLQDAAVAVSYDMPWNPIRLAQRFGRIDRLGSPHARIRTVVFAPDPSVDDVLGLMKRLRSKLRQIRVVGGDAPWALASLQRAPRLVDEIESVDAARERALNIWTLARSGDGAVAPRVPEPGQTRLGPPASPLVAAAQWSRAYDAALCCFATRADMLPVLVRAHRPPGVGTAEAWTVLSDIAAGRCEPAVVDVAEVHEAVSRAWRLAGRALRPRSKHSDRPDNAAQATSTTLMRWLASRPGGATTAEIHQADALLQLLHDGGSAGTGIRVARAVRTLTRPDGPGVREHASSDALFEPRAGARQCQTGPGRLPGRRPGRRPQKDGPPHQLAIILLRAPAAD